MGLYDIRRLRLERADLFTVDPAAPPSLLIYWSVGLFGAVVSAMVFWPGLMSPDSIDQLQQARSAIFHDGHPPILAWLWRWLDVLLPGPVGVLILQALLWWLGFAQLAWITFRGDLRFLWVVLVAGFFPSTFVILGVVWKDVLMSCSFVAAAALMRTAELQRKPWALLAAVPLLALGVGVRPNGIVPGLSMCLWMVIIVQRWRGAGKRTISSAAFAMAMASLATLVIYWSIGAVNRSLATEHRPLFQYHMIHDLVGISVASGEVALPPYMVEDRAITVADLIAVYVPYNADYVYLDDRRARLGVDPVRVAFPLSDEGVNVAQLRSAWVGAIIHHPISYVAHRLKVSEYLFGVVGWVSKIETRACFPTPFGLTPQVAGVEYAVSVGMAKTVKSWLESLAYSPWFDGWLALAVILVLAASWFSILGGADLGIPFVLLSGLAHGAVIALFAASCDYRYTHWVFCAAVVAVIMFAGRLVDRKSAS